MKQGNSEKGNFWGVWKSNSNNDQGCAPHFPRTSAPTSEASLQGSSSACSRLSESSAQTSEHSSSRLLSSTCSRQGPCIPGVQSFQSSCSRLYKWNPAPFLPLQHCPAQPVENVAVTGLITCSSRT